MSEFEATLREVLAAGHTARFRASGDSMYPSICSGDMVDIEPCAVASLRRGDIILARTVRGLTLHRIARIGPGGIVTRGDNALWADRQFAPENILGRVVERQNGVSRWSARGLMKIILYAATFLRRLRSVVHQQLQR